MVGLFWKDQKEKLKEKECRVVQNVQACCVSCCREGRRGKKTKSQSIHLHTYNLSSYLSQYIERHCICLTCISWPQQKCIELNHETVILPRCQLESVQDYKGKILGPIWIFVFEHSVMIYYPGNALGFWICQCRCILESSGSQISGCT